MSPLSVGVDWSSGSWIAIAYAAGSSEPEARVFETIDEVWAAYGDAARRIVVDVPIGLCGSLGGTVCQCVELDGERFRRCDDLARSVLGKRYSSVFTPPAREAAELAASGADHERVTACNESVTGKGLTVQAAAIASGIVAVDELCRGRGDPAVLVEGHPELCFRAFAGEPLVHSKHSAAGVDERLSVLEGVPEYETGQWREVVRRLGEFGGGVGLDDVLDAFALALTALAPEGACRSLPSEVPTDAAGLPMQMVYRSDRALVVDES